MTKSRRAGQITFWLAVVACLEVSIGEVTGVICEAVIFHNERYRATYSFMIKDILALINQVQRGPIWTMDGLMKKFWIPDGGRYFLLFCMTVMLCGCVTSHTSYMTKKDLSDLSEIQRAWAQQPPQEPSVLDRLVNGNPAQLAKESAKSGDYRLIGIAMGYGAQEKDAKPLAIECGSPVETQNVVFGCVPPPEVIFKLMLDYNVTLLRQPDFPSQSGCRISEEAEKAMREMNMRFND